MVNHYIYKYGNKFFKEFQEYFYNELSRRERMDFKRINKFTYSDGYLLNHQDFLRYVRDNIDRKYINYFPYIIKNQKTEPPQFILYFD